MSSPRMGQVTGPILITTRGDSELEPSGLRIVDAETNELLDFFPRVRAAGSSLALDADRTRLLLLDDQNRVRMWSLEWKDWVGEELHPVGRVDHAVFSPRRDLIATATMNGKLSSGRRRQASRPESVSFIP